MNELNQIKTDLKSLVTDQPFKTAFKVTMGYHLANTVATFLGLAVLGTFFLAGCFIVKWMLG